MQTFHVFFFCIFSNFWGGSFEALFKAFFHKSESKLYKQLLKNVDYYFGLKAQKCLKICVYCILKFHLFILNLYSKVPAGVGVRLSKYRYMDIRADFLKVFFFCTNNIFVWQICANKISQETTTFFWKMTQKCKTVVNCVFLRYKTQILRSF